MSGHANGWAIEPHSSVTINTPGEIFIKITEEAPKLSPTQYLPSLSIFLCIYLTTFTPFLQGSFPFGVVKEITHARPNSGEKNTQHTPVKQTSVRAHTLAFRGSGGLCGDVLTPGPGPASTQWPMIDDRWETKAQESESKREGGRRGGGKKKRWQMNTFHWAPISPFYRSVCSAFSPHNYTSIIGWGHSRGDVPTWRRVLIRAALDGLHIIPQHRVDIYWSVLAKRNH